mgnify:CR=1 FL=1
MDSLPVPGYPRRVALDEERTAEVSFVELPGGGGLALTVDTDADSIHLPARVSHGLVTFEELPLVEFILRIAQVGVPPDERAGARRSVLRNLRVARVALQTRASVYSNVPSADEAEGLQAAAVAYADARRAAASEGDQAAAVRELLARALVLLGGR